MNVLLGYRIDFHRDSPVETYARSIEYELAERGHYVTAVGDGHDFASLDQVDPNNYDLLLEIDCGRNRKGQLNLQQPKYELKLPSAVYLIDSHGYPDMHQSIAPKYDHVFFAVWGRRDLFLGHKSAHWCPNATDSRWFYPNSSVEVQYDFGFFGSKGGLSRANKLKEVCQSNGWTCDIRQITKSVKHRWPATAEAMQACRVLYNKGQKHDGPNQRVIESMACKKVLLSDLDPRDGMSKLFVDGFHYVGYNGFDFSDLAEKCKWTLDNQEKAAEIAVNAYREVITRHTISNRVEQILRTIS